MNGLCILIEKNNDETKEDFLDRVNFILSQNVETKKELDKMINLSLIYSNMKSKRVTYSAQLAEKINELTKNCQK